MPIDSGTNSNPSRNRVEKQKPETPAGRGESLLLQSNIVVGCRERSSDAEEASEPLTGDIVEYPLSDLVKSELQDGREKGVGLLVGRNKDRGDAAKLPDDLLGMCEIEPLRQEETDSNKCVCLSSRSHPADDVTCRWIPDEIGCSAFCELASLKKIPVTSYDTRFDIWVIDAALSEGCGGPEIVEEIVL